MNPTLAVAASRDKRRIFSPDNTEYNVGICDHYLLITILNVSPEVEQVLPRTVWLYQRAERDNLRDELDRTNWKNIGETNYPEGSSTQTETIKKAIENHIPRCIEDRMVQLGVWYDTQQETHNLEAIQGQ